MGSSSEEPRDGPEDLTTDGSVVKTILVEGGGEKAGRAAKVAVKYSMRLSQDRNAEPFDSSNKRKGGVLQFTVGRNKVIPALELLAKSMKLGEKCDAQVEAPYAFGSKGLKRKGIPSNSRIYIQVEMLKCEGGEKVKTMAEMSPAERLEQAKKRKESGNNFFKESKYEKAMTQYSQCIRYLSNVFYKPSAPSPSSSKPEAEESDTSKERTDKVDGEGESESPVPTEAKEQRQDGFTEAEVHEEAGANGISPAVADGSNEEEKIERIDVSTAKEPRDQPQSQSAMDRTGSREELGTTAGDQTAPGVTPSSESASAGIAGTEPENVTPASGDDDGDDPAEDEVKALHVTTLNNLSLCLLKLEDYKRAVESASLALRMDSENSKALYYRGRALIGVGEWEKARSDLVSAAKIQPKNMGIRMEIQKLDKKKKHFEEREKKQAAAMFA